MAEGSASSALSPTTGAGADRPSPPTPTTLNAITDPAIRRSLLLQALVARQRPGALGGPKGSSISGSPSSPSPALGSPSIPLPEVPLAPIASSLPAAARLSGAARGESIPLGLSLDEGGAALQEALMTGNWDSVVEGLDAAAAEESPHHQRGGAWAGQGVTTHDLDQAQKQLEAWAQAANAGGAAQANHQPPLAQPYQSGHPSPAPFPWAALYPHAAPPPAAAYAPPPGQGGASQAGLNTAPIPYYNGSTSSTRSHSFSEQHPPTTSPPNGPDPPSTTTPTSSGKKGGGNKGGGKKGKPTKSAAEQAAEAEEEAKVKLAQSLMTPEEIEEDKRRRNTEASARFRAKKKQRDAELNQTTAQLRQRVSELEQETHALKTENRWLRELISEKTGRELDPRLLDLLRATQAGRMEE